MTILQYAFLTSFLALIIALLSLYKALKTPEIIEQQADIILNTLDNTLKETLEPIQQNIKTSYSHKGTLGAHARQVKALDRKIAEDIINQQSPLVQGALDLFPNVKEYVNKNPDLLMELLPRLQQLQSIEGFNPLDLVSPSPSPRHPTPSPSRARVYREE